VEQYARFNVGHVLESPEQIEDIPKILSSFGKPVTIRDESEKAFIPELAGKMLCGTPTSAFSVEG
jgi:hypothetical protein